MGKGLLAVHVSEVSLEKARHFKIFNTIPYLLRGKSISDSNFLGKKKLMSKEGAISLG